MAAAAALSADGAQSPHGERSSPAVVAAGSAAGDGVTSEEPAELPVSQVMVYGHAGRVLMDSGSQLNLASTSFCRAVGARVHPPSGITLQSISGETLEPVGQVLLSVVPVDAVVGEPIFVMFHVVDSLPQQCDMIMHAQPPTKQQFWDLQARKSRRLMSKSERAIRAMRFRNSSRLVTLTAVMVMLAASAAVPGPYEFAKQREELAAEFADPNLEERVADSIAAPAVDLVTAQLQVPVETTPAEVDALRATLLEFGRAFQRQPEGVLMEPVQLPVVDGKRPVASAGHARHVANVDKRNALERDIEQLLAKGIIRRCAPDSDKTFAGQVVMAPKAGSPGQYRFCVDFRQYNDVAAADARGFPTVGESIASLEGCTLFFSLDLMAGFHQIPVAEADKHKLRFVTHLGDFEFNFVPFGITNGPTFCQTLMESVNRDLIGRRVVSIYVDDFAGGDRVSAPAVAGDVDEEAHWVAPRGIRTAWAEMLRNLRRVLRRAVQRRLVFTLQKCRFGFKEHRWLGQLVTAEGRRIDPARFDGLRSMPIPQTKAQLVSFVALASYFREFVPHMADLLVPFSGLLQHNARFTWTEAHTTAFWAVITAIISAGTLVNLDWNHPFVVQVDASKYAVGAVLLTGPPDALRPYAFISRKLHDAETRYNVTEKECLAMHWAVTDKWAEILWGRPFYLHTDHKNLMYMLASENERVRRWVSSLSRFRFKAIHIAGSTNSVADGLSRVGLDPQQRIVAAALVEAGCFADDAAMGEGQDSGVVGATTASSVSGETPHSPQHLQNSFGMFRALVAAQAAMSATERNKWMKGPHRSVILGEFTLLAQELEGGGWAYIVPTGPAGNDIRAEALRLSHDADTAAHGGVDRTVQRLHDGHVTWATVRSDVEQYIRSCGPCQKHKPPTARHHHAHMRHVGAQRTWERLVVDLLQMPRSTDGATHILVAVDAFSRYAVARALPASTAVSVLKALAEGVFSHGYPEIIQTDNGSSFDNVDFTAQMQRWGIAYHRTVPYHHESQGAVERVNRTLLSMIRPLIDGNSQRWEDVLAASVYAYNTAVHDALGMLPHAVMFRHPGNNELSLRFSGGAGGAMESGDNSVGQVIAESDAHTPLLYKSIRKEQAKYLKRRQEQFNKHVSLVHYKAGDMVWVYDDNRPNKLAPQWTGPFKVLSRHAENANLYRVEPPVERGSQKRDADPVVKHVDQLRLANTSRMSTDDILFSAARPDTNIVLRVLGHRGKSPKDYEFEIEWRGEGPLRSTWEPLVGRTADGKPAGVGKAEIVREYMRVNNLESNPTAKNRKGRRVTARR